MKILTNNIFEILKKFWSLENILKFGKIFRNWKKLKFVNKFEIWKRFRNSENIWKSKKNKIGKKLYYINGSVNIRYHGKTMTYSNDLWLWLTFYDICRGGTVARKCKFDFILKLAICLSITLGYRNCPSVTAHVPGLSQQCWGHQPNTQTIKLHCWDL